MSTEKDVRQVVLRHLGAGVGLDNLPADLPLGETGAGLDSIALIEMLLDCEAAFGVPLVDSVLKDGTVTVATIAATIAARRTA